MLSVALLLSLLLTDIGCVAKEAVPSTAVSNDINKRVKADEKIHLRFGANLFPMDNCQYFMNNRKNSKEWRIVCAD
jgi:hypothetical protein